MTTPTIPFYPMTHDDALAQNVVLGQIKDAILAGPDLSMIADEFSTSTAYAVGDYVIYTGGLYRFTSAHAAGVWNSSHAQLVLVTDDLQGKQDTLTFDTTPTASSSNPVTSGGVKSALDAKAPLASPALTGTPTAPTAGTATSTTQIATTAFVQKHAPIHLQVTASAGNSASKSDSRITATMRVIHCVFGTPANVASNVTWTTSAGSIAFSGTFTGSTTIDFDLVETN